jgi:transposase InsO family protein
LKGVADQTPFAHEHESVLGPLFQHSFGSDDHKDDSDVSNHSGELIVFYVNDNHVHDCPQVEISFGELTVTAVLDSGSQVCILAERVYERLVETGLQILTLPLENVALVTAFGNRTRRIKFQAFLEFCIGEDRFECVFLISPQLTGSEAILGCDYAHEYGITIDFVNKCLQYEKDGIRKTQLFCQSRGKREAGSDEVGSNGQPTHNISPIVPTQPIRTETGILPIRFTATQPSCEVPHTNPLATGTLINVEGRGQPSGFCKNEDIESVRQNALRNNDARCSHDECYEDFEIYEVSRVNRDEVYSSHVEGSVVRDVERNNGESSYGGRKGDQFKVGPAGKTEQDVSDPRSLRTADLHALIEVTEGLNNRQKESLSNLLMKYIQHMTSKPGMCRVFEYKFQLSDPKPIVGFSRAIPFAIRPVVREQIKQMIEDDIIEISDSPFINPLTIVYKEDKKLRLCVDARKINQVTIPDRERTPPMHELLQRFNGARFMTSIDLSSAFLQIKLNKESRKYTAFLFDATVYQYKRTPYGFRNSLSAFIRALKLVLGEGIESFIVFYVDDLLLFSPTFEEHLRHIDIVIGKLTKAGFTINAAKCRFCQTEVKFLGHKINQTGVSADPDRVTAIQKYPVPRNAKQLRQFLGTCNFHNRFIVGYANYVAPLLPLLKQGTKWMWTSEKQAAFEKLRECFAGSIHLVHPSQDLPYAIYTDASKYGISSVLVQKNESGETYIISTASRVLTPTEQKYSTCEQELLAVVYALQKFRMYAFGHQITVFSDNKALSFLKKCNLTSNRITRWILQLQEYDLNIIHIKGSDNFLADALSRNPVGLTLEQINQIGRPRDVLVSAIKLNLDSDLKKELGDLAKHQSGDPKIQKIKQKLATALPSVQNKYMLKDDVLYCIDNRSYPFWRIYLPSSLENKVISCVHRSSGHQGTDRCMHDIALTFYVRSLGRKVRKLVSRCDVCQRVKHPNRSYEIESRSHLPKGPGELMALDLYGPLPTGRGGVKYILVCLDVFSKHVKLYPLKSATTKSCLTKLKSHYFLNVTLPQTILSDNGSQFSSPSWRKSLSDLNIAVKYSPIRHPQSNPTERIMRELSKYCKIYCNMTHKKWPELIPVVEKWLNCSVSGATGYSPVELIFNEPKPDVFRKILRKTQDQMPPVESLEDKILHAYARMKQKAADRKRKRRTGTSKWDPQLGDRVLVRCQPVSNAALGLTGKFKRPYEGPYIITKTVPPSAYEISDSKGKLRGMFNKELLKPYLSEVDVG